MGVSVTIRGLIWLACVSVGSFTAVLFGEWKLSLRAVAMKCCSVVRGLLLDGCTPTPLPFAPSVHNRNSNRALVWTLMRHTGSTRGIACLLTSTVDGVVYLTPRSLYRGTAGLGVLENKNALYLAGFGPWTAQQPEPIDYATLEFCCVCRKWITRNVKCLHSSIVKDRK